MSIPRHLLFSATALIALHASGADAQVASQTAPAGNADVRPVDQNVPGDIVVTANKREQKLNDVGLTVAVLSGDTLKEKQINSLADIAQSVPGLSYSNSANGTPIYTLRGVGFIESSLGVYPTVSTYVDEVPLGFPALAAHAAFDLERVEVLKGPQGTIFGQNATGGAINFIAAKPTAKLAAGADLTYGRFNQVIGEAYISGPISDTLTARIAGRIERADGWQVSTSRPGDRNGKVRNYMGRLQLAYEPNSGVRFLLNVNGWKDQSQTQAPQYIGNQPQAPLDPGVAAAPFSPKTDRAADWTPGIPFRDNSFWQTSLRGDIDLFSNVTLTSLSSYTHYKQRQGDEGDGIPATSVDLPLDRGLIKTFSQELRLSNGSGSNFRWVVGSNYEHSSVFQAIDGLFTQTSIAHQLSGLGFKTFGTLRYTTDQKFRNYAFFGNVEYDVIPNVTLKAGARYTNALSRATIFSVDPTDAADGTGAFFFAGLLGGAYGPYAGQPYVINNLGVTNNGVAPGAPGIFTGKLHEDNISYRVGLDWKARPGVLLYVNVSKGYKAGSFPTVSASVFSQYLPVHQESVQAYEAGFKASLFNRVLQLNGAGFYYDYKNKQLRSKTIDPVFGLLDVLQNIPKSSIRGFELEATLRPHRFVVLTSGFTYLDAKIDKFTGINGSGVSAVFDGADMPFTPRYQFANNIDINVPVSSDLVLFTGAGVNYRSGTVAAIGGDVNPPTATPQSFTLFGIKGYATVDAQFGIKSSDDRWRVSIWGKNITNTYYWNNVISGVDVITRFAGMPATYGITGSVKW